MHDRELYRIATDYPFLDLTRIVAGFLGTIVLFEQPLTLPVVRLEALASKN